MMEKMMNQGILGRPVFGQFYVWQVFSGFTFHSLSAQPLSCWVGNSGIRTMGWPFGVHGIKFNI